MAVRKANISISKKYFNKDRRKKIDTVSDNSSFERNTNVLMDAFNAWTNGDDWRKLAARNERYTFGNQWGDYVKDPNGCGYIKEETLIRSEGNQPLKNNRIRVIVRSILGVFSAAQTEPVCVSRERDNQGKGEMMSATLQYVYQLNRLWELDRRNLEYMLLSGVPIFRSTYGWRNNKMDVWTDLVNYNNFFFDNTMQDPRHWDCHLVGQIWDLGLYDVIAQFSDGSKEKADQLRSIYSYVDKDITVSIENTLTSEQKRHMNFFVPTDNTRCRVIEVWKKESKERYRVHDTLTGDYYKVELDEKKFLDAENRKRIAEQGSMGVLPEDMKLLEYEWFVDNYWYYYYFSPQGYILKQGETPYWHDSHPYSFKIYPFYNGRVYPFVSDFIDQQRYINRLIMMQDFIMRSSAKGVLMFPEESLPDGMSMKDIAAEWVSYNGIIYYKAKPGVPAPQQVIANSSQTGAYDMLNIQLKLLEDISGVQGALQGKAPSSGTPASLYMQQTQNSATTLTDLLESYREVREERDMKNLKLIQQYYTEPRYINISSNNVKPNEIVYNPSEVRNTEFDLSITESSSTPAYRMIMNDFLMQLFGAQQITLEELLENGSFPFADKLLQAIQTRKQEAEQAAMMNGQMQQGGPQSPMVPPEIMQQINANTNPQVLNMLNNNQM